jgi:polysaccharide export outer membrane protein
MTLYVLAKRALKLSIVVLFLAGCTALPPLPSSGQPPPIPASIAQQPKTPYVIGPEDVINIVVYGHQDLSTQVTIAADGAFSYPLLGRIQAAGLTAQELESQLAKALTEFVVNPQVNVTVAQFQSQRVHVAGEVKAPGTYVLKHASTLLDLLIGAGGPTENAGWEVLIVRAAAEPQGAGAAGGQRPDNLAPIRIDLARLLAGEFPQSVRVHDGDTIYVPRAAFYYVDGEVTRPGRYRLERDTTVGKALTVAGGATRFAAKTRMKVQRVVAGERQEFHARDTDLLQAEDVLIIPQSVF